MFHAQLMEKAMAFGEVQKALESSRAVLLCSADSVSSVPLQETLSITEVRGVAESSSSSMWILRRSFDSVRCCCVQITRVVGFCLSLCVGVQVSLGRNGGVSWARRWRRARDKDCSPRLDHGCVLSWVSRS